MGGNTPTLCWECKNATGGCSWSADLKPVNRWCAIKTRLKMHNKSGENVNQTSYIVVNCPEFKRDAMQYGLKRVGEGNETTLARRR